MVVELEAQPQQQSALEDARRHARVADRAEQDRVVLAQLLEHRVGQQLAGALPARGAQVVGGASRCRGPPRARTLRPSATTSGPMPSPAITARRMGNDPRSERCGGRRPGPRARRCRPAMSPSSSGGTGLSTVTAISASPPAVGAADLRPGDVDAGLAQRRADGADDARAGRCRRRTAGSPTGRGRCRSRRPRSASAPGSCRTACRRRSPAVPSAIAPRTVTRLR